MDERRCMRGDDMRPLALPCCTRGDSLRPMSELRCMRGDCLRPMARCHEAEGGLWAEAMGRMMATGAM